MKTTTIHKAMRAVAAVLAATCMSLPSHADGFAPREVHGTIWQGLFAPHSPETVAMVTHGDGRHDLHSGSASMSIPVYSWKDNLFEIPVSLGYSYSGLKPGFTSSTVGLGWYLNAGGVITREVRGIPGETAYVEHSYDALGREVGSQLGDSEYGISCGRSYTLQGWLCGLEYRDYADGDVFAESLRYADAPDFGVPSYSGKVSGLSFVHRWHPEQEVAFSYDGMGRLLGSSREDGVSRFTEQGISYDLNGNVLSIRRYGANDATPEDDFALSYVGNALSGLVSSDGTCRSFSHDSNGNMTFDGLRGLTIGYNCLNLPETTSESGMRRATYSYCSDGTKVQAADSLGAGHAYLGSMVYALDGAGCSLESAGFSGGRIVADGASTAVRYHLTDHLGSVRAVAHGEEGDGELVHEQSDYYPFGLRMDDGLAEATSPANRWRFAGKEDQPLLGPGVQDFGARFYDSRLCRWTTQDPLAEKYPGLSPYCYCGGDPVGRVDPDGKEIIIVAERYANESCLLLRYKNGKLWLLNGDEYLGSNSFALETMKALNNLVNSGNDILKNIVYTLESSKRHHYIEKSEQGDNYCRPLGDYGKSLANVGKPVETQTFIDYGQTIETNLETKPETTIAHEMQHAYDYDQGHMKGIIDDRGSLQDDPKERRAVWVENIARKIFGMKQRTTYGNKPIKPLQY